MGEWKQGDGITQERYIKAADVSLLQLIHAGLSLGLGGESLVGGSEIEEQAVVYRAGVWCVAMDPLRAEFNEQSHSGPARIYH